MAKKSTIKKPVPETTEGFSVPILEKWKKVLIFHKADQPKEAFVPVPRDELEQLVNLLARLSEEYRIDATNMVLHPKRAKLGRKSKTFLIREVATDKIHYVRNLTEFCRIHRLRRNRLYELLRGRVHRYKGFESASEEPYLPPITHLVDPEGNVHEVRPNLTKFCNQHGLKTPSVCALRRGRLKHHKGWRIF